MSARFCVYECDRPIASDTTEKVDISPKTDRARPDGPFYDLLPRKLTEVDGTTAHNKELQRVSANQKKCPQEQKKYRKYRAL